MHGRRSLPCELAPLDLDLTRTERINRDARRQRPNTLPNTTHAHVPPMGDQRQLKDYYVPSSFINASPIRLPDVTAAHYEIKAHILNTVPKFHGLPLENPYAHISELISLCSTFRMQGVTDDALMLRLFPFSLKDKAKEWLDSLKPNSIETWAQMETAFLFKFFPPSRTTQVRKAISTFKQLDNEKFHECWDRFTELLRKCPHHKIDRYQLVQYFYEGLEEKLRTLVDASCGGAIMNKNEQEAWDLFTLLAENSLLQVQSTRENPKKGGLYEISPTTDLTAKVDAMCRQMTHLMAMNIEKQQAPSPPKVCEACFVEGHGTQECPALNYYSNMGVEQVNALNSNHDPYSNTFNHPNLSWGPNGQSQNSYQRGPQQSRQHSPYQTPHQRMPYQGNMQNPQQNRGPYYPNNNGNNGQLPHNNQFQNFDAPPPKNQDCELRQMMNNLEQTQAAQAQSFSNLANQMCQMGEALSQLVMRSEPSQTGENPKREEKANVPKQVNAITTLRSGKIFGKEVVNDRCGGDELGDDPKDHGEPSEKECVRGMPKEVHCETSNAPERVYIPKAPYPQALTSGIAPLKKGASMDQLMQTFGEVKINIPLLDAIKQVPAYAKFLKELCTQKRKQVKNLPKRVYMAGQSSGMIQSAFPQKYKDPGSPTVPCIIGKHHIDRALLDLGAGVNVIPYAIYEKLGLGNLRPTHITLELADRSVRVPRGVVEDVLVKVDKFIFPVDFVVLDTESEKSARDQVPIILGRPFLATANATINCRTGLMTITFGNMKARLNIFNNVNAPPNHDSNEDKEVYYLNVIDTPAEKVTPSVTSKEPLDLCLDYEDGDAFDAEGSIRELELMLGTVDYWDKLLENPPMLEMDDTPPLDCVAHLERTQESVSPIGRSGVALTIRHIQVEEKAQPLILGRSPKMRDEWQLLGKVPNASPVHPLRRKPRPKRRTHSSDPLGERRVILRDLVLKTFVQYMFALVTHLLFIFQPKRRRVIECEPCESTRLVDAAYS